jgi:hypothetical protein
VQSKAIAHPTDARLCHRALEVATPATKPKGGQFVLHATALHGNPFDGHTLGLVVAELEA